MSSSSPDIFFIITDRIRRIGEGNVFSLSTPGGGRVTRPGPDGGGVPQPGLTPGTPWPGQDGGYEGDPLPSMGSPTHPRDRTAHGVLDTPRSVCLLRSRRRSFLFCLQVRFPRNHIHSSVQRLLIVNTELSVDESIVSLKRRLQATSIRR